MNNEELTACAESLHVRMQSLNEDSELCGEIDKISFGVDLNDEMTITTTLQVGGDCSLSTVNGLRSDIVRDEAVAIAKQWRADDDLRSNISIMVRSSCGHASGTSRGWLPASDPDNVVKY